MKPAIVMPWAAGWARLRRRWQALPPRERALAAAAAGLLAVTLLWWLALGPALSLLRSAPAQHQALDAQLQRMLRLQAQARAMQATARSLPPVPREDARRALEDAVRQHLGDAARLNVGGDSATLVLTGVPGESLAQWLAQARIEARTRPSEARLNRNPSGLWEGQLALALPPR